MINDWKEIMLSSFSSQRCFFGLQSRFKNSILSTKTKANSITQIYFIWTIFSQKIIFIPYYSND
jgi:hypothetical protein